ncbi:MAG: DNRLRE domain-containing protein [archaeon]
MKAAILIFICLLPFALAKEVPLSNHFTVNSEFGDLSYQLPFFYSGAYEIAGEDDPRVVKSVLMFDVSGIDHVEDAWLVLNIRQTNDLTKHGNAQTLQINPLLNPVPTHPTWNSLNDATGKGISVTIDQIDSGKASITINSDDPDWPLEIVRGWVNNPASNRGLLLRAADETVHNLMQFSLDTHLVIITGDADDPAVIPPEAQNTQLSQAPGSQGGGDTPADGPGDSSDGDVGDAGDGSGIGDDGGDAGSPGQPGTGEGGTPGSGGVGPSGDESGAGGSPAQEPGLCPDFDGNGWVGYTDLQLIASKIGKTSPGGYDLDGSGVIDDTDVDLVGRYYGQLCGSGNCGQLISIYNNADQAGDNLIKMEIGGSVAECCEADAESCGGLEMLDAAQYAPSTNPAAGGSQNFWDETLDVTSQSDPAETALVANERTYTIRYPENIQTAIFDISVNVADGLFEIEISFTDGRVHALYNKLALGSDVDSASWMQDSEMDAPYPMTDSWVFVSGTVPAVVRFDLGPYLNLITKVSAAAEGRFYLFSYSWSDGWEKDALTEIRFSVS